MKKKWNVIGIIVMLMIIGMMVVGCENPSSKGDDEEEEEVVTPDLIESTNVGTLLPVAAGTFTMGSPASEANRGSDETQHSVTLTKFYMSKYEITQAQYKKVMGSSADPSYFKGNNLPVEMVSWYDAIVFCNTLSIKEGLTPAYTIGGKTKPSDWGAVPAVDNATWNAVTCNWNANGYRLPTEAEWEYAARGKTTTAYNTGNTENDTFKAAAWYSANAGSTTHEVGKKTANAYGLYDMHGNVFEWCWDWYGTYPTAAETNPTGALSGTSRVVRGGSWFDAAQYLRSADRYDANPYTLRNVLGFRLVRP